MKSFLFTLLALVILTSQIQAQEPDQVIEFFRHGARAPVVSYDPQWPASQLGTLMTAGMVEHYNLGKSIAAKYPNLIASGYNPNDVYALANNVPRVIQSALVQLSSIFRGKTSTLTKSSQQSLVDKLIAQYTPSLSANESSRGNYVPINVNIVASGSQDELIFNGRDPAYCPNLASYIAADKKSTAWTQGLAKFKTSIQQANKHLSGSQFIGNLDTLVSAYDAFIADKFAGKRLPGGISDWNLVESLNYGQMYAQFAGSQLQKIQNQLTSYNTIRAIKDQMTNFRQGSNAKKLVLLGGHDENIISVLSAFGVLSLDCLVTNYQNYTNNQTLSYPNCHYPGFASNLIFELYNSTSTPYVKVYYNDVIVPLCGGQDTCDYNDFIAFLGNATEIDSVKTWNKKCGNSQTAYGAGLSTGGLIVIVAGFAVAIAGILAGVGAAGILVKKKSMKGNQYVDVKGAQHAKVVTVAADLEV